MRWFVFVCIFSLFSSGCWDSIYEAPPQSVKIQGTKVSDDWQSDLARLLKTYVHPTNGSVNYTELQKESAVVDSILLALAKLDPRTWDEKERLANWINIYNICMIWNILQEYPSGAFKTKRVSGFSAEYFNKRKFQIGDLILSLDEIENNVLRKQKPIASVSVDTLRPEIHVAVSCAAKSCPPLKNSIWKADTVDQELKQRFKATLNDKAFFTYNEKEKKPEVTLLINWFFDDFKIDGKTVGESLAEFIDDKILKKALIDAKNDTKKFIFMDYDWNLHDWKKSSGG